MEIKEVNCPVCNQPFNISKENVYMAKVENVFFILQKIIVLRTVPIVIVRIYCRNGLRKWENSYRKPYIRKWRLVRL